MAKVTAFRLSRPEAVALLRSLAADSSNVVFLPHALLRMRQRKITPREVIACLRLGNVIEGPALDLKGCWAMRIERTRGGRRMTVAAAIDLPQRLIVITVFAGKD